MADSRLIVSQTFFALPAELLAQLRARREGRQHDDEIERRHDAFLLDPGLGPATYLTSDGRILWLDDGWSVEPTRKSIYAAIAAGAKKTGISGLLELLPERPSDSTDCGECHATGRFDAQGQLVDVDKKPFSIVCPTCGGLGWLSKRLDLSLDTPWAS